jgi:ribonuclease BN (tRNA processing enzyme)
VDKVIIRFLGTHNAESRNTKLASLVIDNKFAFDAGNLTSELSFPEQEKIKAIFLTHGHYDHIRCVPAFAFNNACQTTKVFGLPQTIEILSTHLVDGLIYPKFSENNPICQTQSLDFIEIEYYKPIDIEGYQVLAVPVSHTVEAAGFEITSKDGRKVFYSGDTGKGISDIWNHISPDIIIIEVTFPNKMEEVAKNSVHLCPKYLYEELKKLHEIKGFIPKIVILHMTPKYEREIKKEVMEIAKKLQLTVEFAKEGDQITV